MRLDELAGKIGAQVAGDGALEVRAVATIECAGEGEISFIANPKYMSQLESTKASAVIVAPSVNANHVTLLKAKNPYLAFGQAAVILHGHKKHPHAGIHPKAHVESTAKVGEGTVIYPGAYIGPGTTVGRDCVIYPNVVIYDDCTIGDRVIIHSGTVIGQDGFGFAQDKGMHVKIPQLGSVRIEDDVEIGANCCIARGTLETTTIGKGTKIDGAVVVGHGTQIGPHCILVAQVGIAGSTSLGHHVVVAGQAGIIGHLNIGNMVTIGANTAVIGDIEDNAVVWGIPAMPASRARRVMAINGKLPELLERVREVERRIDELADTGDTPIA